MIPLNYTADSSKPIVIPVDLKPRYRDSDMAHIAADSTVAFLVVEVDWKPRRKAFSPSPPEAALRDDCGERPRSVWIPALQV
jgi:hypothetical protein